MKKITLITIIITSLFFACKKEDTNVEPTPVTPPATCTTCPYCVIDTAVVDTMPHMIATIDDTIHFVASELHDTIYRNGGTTWDDYIIGRNTFVSGTPEITIFFHRTFGASGQYQYSIGDTTVNLYMTYKTNNVIFHSKKGILFDRKWIVKNQPPTYYEYFYNYASNFCFNTDTINGVSHKIKLGSLRIKGY